jgi:putative membrane protein
MKFNRSLIYLTAMCAVVFLGSTAASKAQAGASPADKHFVTAALKGGMAEVKLGQMAADHGNSDDVKQFGQKMVVDHTKLGDQMKGVADQVGVTPPTMMTAADTAEEAKLKVLSGDAFDKAYIQAMVKAHREDLAAFNKEASDGSSPAVKDAASNGSKLISMHLDMIQKIAHAHQVAAN